MEQVIDILESARELLKDKKSWTQGEFARNKEGTPVWIMDEEAVQWCLIGAIDRVSRPKIEKDEKYYNAKMTALAVLHKRWNVEDYYKTGEEMMEYHENIPFLYTDLLQFNDDMDIDHTRIIDRIDESINIVKDIYESNE